MRARRLAKSGRVDLNHRPPVPQTGALTRLRHAPRYSDYAGHMYQLPRSVVKQLFAAPAFLRLERGAPAATVDIDEQRGCHGEWEGAACGHRHTTNKRVE